MNFPTERRKWFEHRSVSSLSVQSYRKSEDSSEKKLFLLTDVFIT